MKLPSVATLLGNQWKISRSICTFVSRTKRSKHQWKEVAVVAAVRQAPVRGEIILPPTNHP
jgi:hypothetical protein